MNRLGLVISLLLPFLIGCVPERILAPTVTPTVISTSTGTPISQPTAGKIDGKVMDSSDGSFIPFANVSTDPPTSSVTTDERGDYSIADVSPGNYAVTASKFGYTSASVNIAVGTNRTTTTDLHLTASLTNILPTSTPVPAMTPHASKDLVAYYPFNGNANDESGNGHHGAAYGATLTLDRFENPDSAYLFDGIDDYIALPDNLNIVDTDFSISAWIKPSDYGIKSPMSSSCHRFIFSYRYRSHASGHSTNGGLRFGLNEDSGCGGNNYLTIAFFKPDFAASGINHEYDSTDWFLYTVTRASEEMIIYVNGEAVSWNETSGGPLYENPAHFYSTIGAQRVRIVEGVAFPFAGIIDDVHIYNYALSESQIREDLLP
ncbi:MAG: hypothetical protein GY832_24830 [Chloroflexi bacterium]|nr:hypothetical protein [Chloroflexota bacterium]